MFQTLRNAWKIEDLRKKLLFTLLILVIVRLGCAIPVPFLDPSRLQEMLDSTQGNLLGYLNLLTGGAFAEATLFALGVSPYITASIVIQLLTVAIPSLERMAKEGPEGQKKIKKITRYSTIGLAILQAYAYYTLLRSSQFNAVKYTTGAAAWISGIAIVLAFSAGAMLVVWLGERIDEKGIGNGISLILFAGIVARIPTLITRLITYIQLGEFYPQYYAWVPLVVILFIAMIAFIVLMNGAERRIPVQYAKRQVGRKMYGGQASTLPMKVNMSGVLPIIFAQSIASLPATVWAFVGTPDKDTSPVAYSIYSAIDTKSVLYLIVYFLMIIGFSYFYATIQFNPVEISNNLKKNGGFIPGFRPGQPTSQFIAKVLNKVTLFGAIYLGIVAIAPLIVGKALDNYSLAIGGTSVIIVVGVALETVQALESQMLMRQYKGFLE